MKILNAFLKTSPKIGDKVVLMAVLWLGVLTTPLKGCYLKRA
ncbi:hypothetical protein [Helicobacter pylori]|nr:hypothetical protein [Helicobacter pylori]